MKALLAAVTLVGLAAVVGAVVVGSIVFDGTVSEKPYEEGLSWDEKRKEREDSGLTVALGPGPYRTGEQRLTFTVTERGGGPSGDRGATLRISRPSTAEHTAVCAAGVQGDGAFFCDVIIPFRGRWLVDVLVPHEGSILEFHREINVDR